MSYRSLLTAVYGLTAAIIGSAWALGTLSDEAAVLALSAMVVLGSIADARTQDNDRKLAQINAVEDIILARKQGLLTLNITDEIVVHQALKDTFWDELCEQRFWVLATMARRLIGGTMRH